MGSRAPFPSCSTICVLIDPSKPSCSHHSDCCTPPSWLQHCIPYPSATFLQSLASDCYQALLAQNIQVDQSHLHKCWLWCGHVGMSICLNITSRMGCFTERWNCQMLQRSISARMVFWMVSLLKLLPTKWVSLLCLVITTPDFVMTNWWTMKLLPFVALIHYILVSFIFFKTFLT